MRRAQQEYLTTQQVPTDKSAERCLIWYAESKGETAKIPSQVGTRTIPAYVNHGRWVADCPEVNCGSAQVVSPDDPRFFCVHCGNDGKWLKVQFPKFVAEIESALSQRQKFINRNWYPGETPQDLERENKAGGQL